MEGENRKFSDRVNLSAIKGQDNTEQTPTIRLLCQAANDIWEKGDSSRPNVNSNIKISQSRIWKARETRI